MAIRVDVFREIGLDKIWPRTISDDLSLSRAVKKAGKKVEFVPACLVASYESTTWRKLFEFAQRGYEIWGVDVGSDAIRLCKELLPQGHFIRGELQETGLPDSHFDYIRIDNALEHVPNPKQVIAECRRLLCGGGQLMIYVPHGRSLSMRFLKGNSISAWIPFHFQLFTRKSLRQLLEGMGFKHVCIYEYSPISWLPLTIMQWRNQRHPTVKYNHPHWFTLACYPIGYLAAKFGMGEELVAIGKTE